MVFGGFSPFYKHIHTVPGSTSLDALFLQKGMARHTACYVSKNLALSPVSATPPPPPFYGKKGVRNLEQ